MAPLPQRSSVLPAEGLEAYPDGVELETFEERLAVLEAVREQLVALIILARASENDFVLHSIRPTTHACEADNLRTR